MKQLILDSELCARCGGCVAACPPNILVVGEDGLPGLVADFSATNPPCEDCNLCLEVCPGLDTGVAASELRLFGRHRSVSERWTGIARSYHSLTCLDGRVLSRASAGGAGTALMLTALRHGLVDAVVVIGRDPERPWVPKAVVTASEDVVISCAQSTYCIAPNLQVLRDAGQWDRLGMVGLPCEIQALQKMAGLGLDVAAKVVFTVELACASSTRLAGTEHLIENVLNLKLCDVKEVRYREGPYPGNFVVRTRDSSESSVPFWQLVEEFKPFKTYRCSACPDWWSGLADISICDGDPNIFKTSKNATDHPKYSTVVVRSEMGERIVEAGQALGLIDIRPHAFDPGESLGLQRKRHRYNALARSSTRLVPMAAQLHEEPFELLSDDAVISTMSRTEDPGVLPVGGHVDPKADDR